MLAPGPEGLLARIPDPGGLPEWLSRRDFDVYVEEFSRNGFTGPDRSTGIGASTATGN